MMNRLKKYLWLILLVIFLAVGVFGVHRDEAIDVYEKARTICLECIGLG